MAKTVCVTGAGVAGLASAVRYGIWFIKGGMHTMASSMKCLFLVLGGTVKYNTPVDGIVIEDKKATGIKVNGEKILSDYVMCNADFPYAMNNLLKDKKAKGKYTDKKSII